MAGKKETPKVETKDVVKSTDVVETKKDMVEARFVPK